MLNSSSAAVRALPSAGSALRFKAQGKPATPSSSERPVFSDDATVKVQDLLAGDVFYFMDHMMDKWRKDPQSVHPSWSNYFTQVQQGNQAADAFENAIDASLSGLLTDDTARETARVVAMIRHFASLGHFHSDIEPLKLPRCEPFVTRARAKAMQSVSDFSLESFGFQQADRSKAVRISLPGFGGFLGGCNGTQSVFPPEVARYLAQLPKDGEKQEWTIGMLYDRLKEIYTGPIGAEYLHINDRSRLNWLRDQLETPQKYQYSKEMKLKILDRTIEAVQFETFAAQKFATMKRFGLDGCEGAIVGMQNIAALAPLVGAESVVLGMAHRGRLSCLTNVMKKPAKQVFSEFTGTTSFGGSKWGNSGDVKYHMGVEYEYVDEATGKQMLMSILPNPSHLEAVDGVLLGTTKARQIMKNDPQGQKVIPVMVHGDAALAGQGVCYETLQMSDLPGYHTGGCIHIVFNNQIGFTTNPVDSGSGMYCTDVAKAVGAPVLHVNADDPEAVSYAMEVAVKYRQRFSADVMIDVVGYRRFGHNELDMPKFTQPVMYNIIDKHPNVLKIYGEKLIKEGVLSQAEFKARCDAHLKSLDEAYKSAKTFKPNPVLRPFSPQWADMATPSEICTPRLTGVAEEVLKQIGQEINVIPSHIKPHPTIAKVYKSREEAIQSGKGIDFGSAEALAYATLLREGCRVRLAGQDAERGTFSHRHAVVKSSDGQQYFPLQEMAKKRGLDVTVDVHNSPLSEYAALAFEYGFSMENPKWLSIWEAQFGDFANGAQIVIDQFIASGETKWNHPSGLVMLLPHGYDGQGPEHSSCRLERFLTLCDDREDVIHPEFWDVAKRSVIQHHNMQVCNVTTASNFFHLLRRQINRGFRKPLIVCSPKKLLRMREACSPLSEFVSGTRFSRYICDPLFEAPVRDDSDIGEGVGRDGVKKLAPRAGVERLILCSGQVYYDLVKARAQNKLTDKVMIGRVEQISPFPLDQVANDLMSLPDLKSVVWCQEEPMNQGPWNYASKRVRAVLKHCGNPNGVDKVIFAGRDTLATTATGDHHIHQTELSRLLKDALDLKRTENSYIEKYMSNHTEDLH